LRLFDALGRPLLEVERLEARRVLASAFLEQDRLASKELSYELVWQARAGQGEAQLARGSFVVLGGESRTGAELAGRIRAAGQRCYLLADPAGLTRLLAQVEQPLAGIVHLEGWQRGAPRALEPEAEELDLLGLAAAHE